MKSHWKIALAGALAGVVNGLFGAGGGMLLVPLLTFLGAFGEEDIFPNSVSIILPLSAVSLSVDALHGGLPFSDALPYLLGGAIGGLLAGLTGNKIPVKWLHRILGFMILYGGVRYLWM